MAEYQEASDLKELAKLIISKKPDVYHVELDRILFLWELETRPGSGSTMARTFRFGDHPIGFFCPEPYGIVFYEANMDYMNQNQRAILMYHELLHIPEREQDPLVDHTHKEFRQMLQIDIDWGQPGKEVPNILE